MTQALAQKRCLNHALREAVCRCPACTRFFCRECVTEHDGKLLCRGCLASRAVAVSKKARATWVFPFLRAVVGCLFLWGIFYYFGGLIASMPTSLQGAGK